MKIALWTQASLPKGEGGSLREDFLKKTFAPMGALHVVNAQQLSKALEEQPDVVVLAGGSYFPKAAWPSLYAYFQAGGCLLYLGGKPFNRPLRIVGGKLSAESSQTAYFQSLGIDQIHEALQKPSFSARSSGVFSAFEKFSFVFPEVWALCPRFAELDEEPYHGAVGPMEGWVYPILVTQDEQGRLLNAPAVVWDRPQGRFAGGRWVFLPARLPKPGPQFSLFLQEALRLAAQGAVDARVSPQKACYFPGERPVLEGWVRAHPRRGRVTLRTKLWKDDRLLGEERWEVSTRETSWYATKPLSLPVEAGLYRLETEVFVDGRTSHRLENGFWGWDEALLKRTAKVGCEGSRFLKNGKPLLVVGTTYMASDVSRKFHTHPNPVLWDRDFTRMKNQGITMIRTGLWTAHRQLLLDAGAPRRDTLAALDAFLLTAAKHDLPVIFNCFAFIPDHWPSLHPYLDERALAMQREFLSLLANRWKNFPNLIWDLINEPSVTNPRRLWKTRPLEGEMEKKAFRKWLQERHETLENLQERWNVTNAEYADWKDVPLPAEKDFDDFSTPTNTRRIPAAAYDFHCFSKDLFKNWTAFSKSILHTAGGKKLFGVGQDEGGLVDRPSQWDIASSVDWTCNHTWWEIPDLLWGNTAPRVKGKPFLAQETGVMFTENPDAVQRRGEWEAARLLERKAAASFLGAGFIQWCWNINPYMNDRNEAMIGAYRVDQTVRAQGLVLEAMGEFAKHAQPYLQGEPEASKLAVVFPKTGLACPRIAPFVDRAQRLCHRLLGSLGIPFHSIGEEHFSLVKEEKIVWFAACQVMEENTFRLWTRALEGRMAVLTGPIDRDGWGRPAGGLSFFGHREKRFPVEVEEPWEGKGESGSVFYEKAALGAVDKDVSLSSRWHRFDRKKGTLLYSPLPLEASLSRERIRKAYEEALALLEVKPAVRWEGAGPFEVTVVPRFFGDVVFYIAWNESPSEKKIQVENLSFGHKVVLNLPGAGATLGVFDRAGKALALYRPPLPGSF